MSETAHTPGPWACHPAAAQVDAFNEGFPIPVCQLLWPTDLRSEEETEANARLIAAAPDLLAALVMAETVLIERGLTGENMAVKQIRAALSKASANSIEEDVK